jgi:hypothetical protein
MTVGSAGTFVEVERLDEGWSAVTEDDNALAP